MTPNAKRTGLRVLVLYTELAPYVLAGLESLVREYGAVVDVVRWPVNAEAPFLLDPIAGMTLHERRSLTDADLIDLADRAGPDITLCAGWMDKSYLRVCRHLRARGRRTVLCSDTAWRGDLRQRFAARVGQMLFHRVFSHAWVTGRGQREYALRLGFRPDQIHTGFYAADTRLFLPMGERLLRARTERWPHRFLCVARYIPAKNHQLLCDAFASLVDAGEAGDWELWSAGTGELHEQVRNSPAGRHERIRHVGFIQASAMEPLLEQCGVFVLASNYEPWGVVVQEQACAAFPLVLSDRVMAAERFLDPGVNGSSFKADDLEALKNALRDIVRKSDAELRAMGRHSMELGRAWGPSDWARTCNGIANATL
jgi:glycosyltransferase involved in cell wall biosynthesis